MFKEETQKLSLQQVQANLIPTHPTKLLYIHNLLPLINTAPISQIIVFIQVSTKSL